QRYGRTWRERHQWRRKRLHCRRRRRRRSRSPTDWRHHAEPGPCDAKRGHIRPPDAAAGEHGAEPDECADRIGVDQQYHDPTGIPDRRHSSIPQFSAGLEGEFAQRHAESGGGAAHGYNAAAESAAGLWLGLNDRGIRIAAINVTASNETFRSQLLDLVTSV